jgi:alpha-beta hydrolase superfamily lysophospholipase
VVAALAVGLAALVLIGPALMSAGRSHLPVAGTPADYGLRYEDLAFAPSDRPLTLRGWWMPPATAPRAAVVLVHGGGEDNRTQPYQNGLALARDLVARGFAVLAFDLRNFGESDATPEGSTFGDLEAHDVVGAASAIAARAPELPVVGLGCSMGGATVIQAAARGARLRAIVVDSTFADAAEVAVPFTVAATGWPRLLVWPFVWSAVHLHGVPVGRGTTLAAARRVPASVPALIVHNEADPIVPAAHAHRLATVLPRSEVWLTRAPPPDHPIVWQQGVFGTHCQSYKLDPAAYVTHVTAFVERAGAAHAP